MSIIYGGRKPIAASKLDITISIPCGQAQQNGQSVLLAAVYTLCHQSGIRLVGYLGDTQNRYGYPSCRHQNNVCRVAYHSFVVVFFSACLIL